MQHYHYTNIDHGHEINDPGHLHAMPRFVDGSGSVPEEQKKADNNGWSNYGSPYEQNTYRSTTGVRVEDLPETNKFSSGALANAQWAGRTETDSNDYNAQENRPSNFTARLWKRIA